MAPVDLSSETRPTNANEVRRSFAVAEVGLIFLVLFVWAGSPPPDVNEAHYLGKAKHYWDPSWSQGDFFLESADAHLVFYWTFGWVAALLPLPAAAWVGRVVAWLLLAWSWRRLSWSLVPRPMFAVLSAALFLVLLDWCELAGEWVAEGVEAKTFAFGFVFLGVAAVVRNRWNMAWLLLGAASAFHVLVGGWTTLAAGIGWLTAGHDRPRWTAMLPGLVGGLVLSLPGLIPGWLLTRGFAPQTVDEANQIYVYYRLPHHLLPSAFSPDKYAAYGALLAAFVVLGVLTVREGKLDGRARRLWGVVAGALLIGAAGMAIFLVTQNNPPLAAKLLRFYFFRASDALLPLGASLTCGVLAMRWASSHPKRSATLIVVAVLISAAGIGARFFDRQRDFRPGADRQALPAFPDPRETEAAYDAWRRLGQWIDSHTPPGARFLTPRAQQTFKWYAQRAEVVTWKDVPQDAAALVEWRRRFDEIYGPIGWRGLTAYSDEQLADLARKYDAQYIVIDRRRAARRLGLERVYPAWPHENLYYEVYRAPHAPTENR
jgi:hypothetical protein